MIMLCNKLFKEHKEVLKLFKDKFQYILVDEYQDINQAQLVWLLYLSEGNKNVTCVGDDD